MRYLFLLALLSRALVAPASLLADTVNSFVCSTPATTQTTNSGSACSAQGFYGYAKANATATLSLPVNPNQAAQLNVESDVSALLAGVRGIGTESLAQSSSNVSLNFSTASPVQNGFLEFTFLQNTWSLPAYGSASESLTIGSYSVNPNGQSLSMFIPIQLGSAFAFNYVQTLTGIGDAGSGNALGSVASTISLQAFEADRTTAVALFDPPSSGSIAATPEPASFSILSVGLILMLGLILRFGRSTN